MKLVIVNGNALSLRVFFEPQTAYFVQHGVDTLTVSAPGQELDKFGLATGSRTAPVTMSRRMDPLADLRAVYSLWRLLRRERPDVVHAHMPKGGLIGMLAALAAGVPVRMFTAHGLRSESEKGWRLWILRMAEWLTFACATHALAVSDTLRRAVVDARLCPAGKIRVLASGGCAGVDIARFDPIRYPADAARASLLAEYGIPRDAFVLCYAGRIAKAKGMEDLLFAWRALRGMYPGLWLLLCGPVDDEDPLPEGVLEAFEADERVTMTKRINRNMPEILAGADLCVLPSYREGLGVSALEAGAMKKAVVAYAAGGLTDAICDGCTGLLVPVGDREALLGAVDLLLADPLRREAMEEAGRRFVQGSFNAAAVSWLLLLEYRELAGELWTREDRAGIPEPAGRG